MLKSAESSRMTPLVSSTYPDDATLTYKGFQDRQTGRILVVACGALAREILDLCRQNHWSHIDLTCLPAILHNHPDKITERVTNVVTVNRQRYMRIFVAYADCGTGGQLKSACCNLGVEMIAGPHCYSFFEGNRVFSKRENEISAFYLTDFLVRQFDAFVWQPLGLDRHPDLRDIYFARYTKLIYQAQTRCPHLITQAESCAKRLNLEFEYRFTGYGDLASTMARWAQRSV